MTRHITTLSIIVFIIMAPYWVYVPLIIFAMIAFPFYFEAIIFGVIIDSVYGPPHSFFVVPFALTLATLLALSLPLRNYVRLQT